MDLHEVDSDHVLELEGEQRGPRQTEEALVPPARELMKVNKLVKIPKVDIFTGKRGGVGWTRRDCRL